ncbi:MAG: winged helix-turn-helix domain-containing protein [Candidatus Thermoplasmatota archaeon]|nr:winged helix-turn-helix domain-containing protein [Candidatus Thermoplasmatota archaeon]
MQRLLWHLIVGTRGGINRAQILLLLKDRPYNANSLAEELGLDYKTVRHHLRVLRKNDLVMVSKEEHSTLYFLTPTMLRLWEDFEGIWKKIGKK